MIRHKLGIGPSMVYATGKNYGDETMEHADHTTSEKETRLETQLQARLGSQVRNLRVVCRTTGVILKGRARTYYAKQLAQHSVMEITSLAVLANEIEVR